MKRVGAKEAGSRSLVVNEHGSTWYTHSPIMCSRLALDVDQKLEHGRRMSVT